MALDNLTYNIITVLHEKSKGLEAYEKYLKDAGQSEVRQIFEEIRRSDEQHIEKLRGALSNLLHRGQKAA